MYYFAVGYYIYGPPLTLVQAVAEAHGCAGAYIVREDNSVCVRNAGSDTAIRHVTAAGAETTLARRKTRRSARTWAA